MPIHDAGLEGIRELEIAAARVITRRTKEEQLKEAGVPVNVSGIEKWKNLDAVPMKCKSE